MAQLGQHGDADQHVRDARPILTASVIVAIVALAACDSATAQREDQAGAMAEVADAARAQGRAEVADILEDGSVTFAEYEQAFNLMKSCAEGGGLSVSDDGVNPVDQLAYLYTIDYNGIDSGVAEPIADKCQADYFTDVAAWYIATNEPALSTPLREPAYDCMERGGFSIERTETSYQELAGGDPSDVRRLEFAAECVADAMERVYPEIESFGVAY